MEILSSTEQQSLIKNGNLMDLVSNDYLSDKKNENLILIANLFFNDDIDRAKSFNIGSNLFQTITDSFRYFIGSPKTDIDLNLQKYVQDYITVGKAVFGIGVKDGEFIVEHIPAKGYIYSNGEHKVFKYYQGIVEDETVYFLLKQTYTSGSITNELFQLDSLESLEGDKVAIDTIPQTAKLEENIPTGLEDSSIYVVEDSNILDGKNQSIIDKIKNTVYSIDRKQVMFETQFLQEVDQYKIFENIAIPDYAYNSDGSIDLKSMGKVLATDSTLGASGDIKFISNANGLIKDAMAYEETQLKKISSALFIPLDFLGLNTSGTTSGSSRTIMISSFIKSVESKRKDIEKQALLPILKLLKEKGAKNENGDKITTNIYWDDVLPTSGSDLANEYKTAIEAGLISQYSAIKLYNKLNTEEEVNIELENFNTQIGNTETEQTDNTETTKQEKPKQETK